MKDKELYKIVEFPQSLIDSLEEYEKTRKIISNLWSKVKIAASNAN